MKAHAIAGLLACWILTTGASPTPRLRVSVEGLLGDVEPTARLPSLPYRLEQLDETRGGPEQIAAQAEEMLLARRFDEARPLLSALAGYPDFELHSAFMEGYVALQQREFAVAAERLQRAVSIRPDYTRARVELGQALMELGRTREADQQFQIAERDRSLPPQILELVRIGRRRTAERARWHLNVDAGVLADSSIEAPADVGGRREGVGTSTAASGGVRLRIGDRTALALEAEGYWNRFGGGTPDDVSMLIAGGPELRLSDGIATIQAIGYARWYGDVVSSSGVGLRGRYQQRVGEGQRIYLLIDGRVFNSGYGDDFGGWQASGFFIYEHAVNDGLTLSATVYGRREWLGSDTFSNAELGGYLGAATRLPLGLRASVSAGAVRAMYDAPFLRFSDEPRQDWRLSGSLYVGLRRALPGDIWPTLSYHYISTASSLSVYDAERHRIRLNLRRPF